VTQNLKHCTLTEKKHFMGVNRVNSEIRDADGQTKYQIPPLDIALNLRTLQIMLLICNTRTRPSIGTRTLYCRVDAYH
jgi:hypothetical protein